MKKIAICLVILLMLCGCAPKELETMTDVYGSEPSASPAKILFELPEDASVFTALNDGSKLYFCDGYELVVETFRSGDLDRTLQTVTGYRRDVLTLMQTERNGLNRTECAWTAVGDDGDLVARTVILDDGAYHYCVSMYADALEAGALQKVWQSIGASISLS